MQSGRIRKGLGFIILKHVGLGSRKQEKVRNTRGMRCSKLDREFVGHLSRRRRQERKLGSKTKKRQNSQMDEDATRSDRSLFNELRRLDPSVSKSLYIKDRTWDRQALEDDLKICRRMSEVYTQGSAGSADPGSSSAAPAVSARAVEEAAVPSREMSVEDAEVGSPGSPKRSRDDPEAEDPDEVAPKTYRIADQDEDVEALLSQTLANSRSEFFTGLLYEMSTRPVCEEPAPEMDDSWYFDDVSGRALDSAMVRRVRMEEMEFTSSINLWTAVDRKPGMYVVGTRWVDVNKGDSESPLYRSRLVAKEFRQQDPTSKFFAGTPPAHSLRLLFSLAVTRSFVGPSGKKTCHNIGDWQISFIDVKRAHFYAQAKREVYVVLPQEAGAGEGQVGRLNRTMYGCKDAAQEWELEVTKVLTSAGFEQGSSTPCVYVHVEKCLRCTVHGDDFTTLGPRPSLDWLFGVASKSWQCKLRGVLGAPGTPNTTQHMVILNRLVSWDERGIHLEADPRHRDIPAQELGVTKGIVGTPMAKPVAGDEAKPLSSEEVSQFRSLAMRAMYLSFDRPDLVVVTRELSKGMQKPTSEHWSILKRLGRYLVGHGRLVQHFHVQDSFSVLEGWSDSNHAGCIRTRKSASGFCCMAGRHLVYFQSRGQGVIALSSAEAEYYALVSSMSSLLGLESLCKDWHVYPKLRIYMDATAAISIGNRRGLGRVKHIETIFLWCQEVVTKRHVSVVKKHTSEMLADIRTKATDRTTLDTQLHAMGYTHETGRHRLALSV